MAKLRSRTPSIASSTTSHPNSNVTENAHLNLEETISVLEENIAVSEQFGATSVPPSPTISCSSLVNAHDSTGSSTSSSPPDSPVLTASSELMLIFIDNRTPYFLPSDGRMVKIEENPHFFILCRFLCVFKQLINFSWNFQQIINAFQQPGPATPFCVTLFARLFNLIGRRGMNELCFNRMVSEFCRRRHLDRTYLFHKSMNPFHNGKTWDNVPPHHRLRVLRLVLNYVLAESPQVHKLIQNGAVSIDDLEDGSFGRDEPDKLYWLLTEVENDTRIKFYKQNETNGTLELLADDRATLEVILESFLADPQTVELGEKLKAKTLQIAASERALSRQIRQQKALSRQLDNTQYTEGQRKRRAIDYTFRVFDEQINKAEKFSKKNKFGDDIEDDLSEEERLLQEAKEKRRDRGARLDARNAQKDLLYAYSASDILSNETQEVTKSSSFDNITTNDVSALTSSVSASIALTSENAGEFFEDHNPADSKESNISDKDDSSDILEIIKEDDDDEEFKPNKRNDFHKFHKKRGKLPGVQMRSDLTGSRIKRGGFSGAHTATKQIPISYQETQIDTNQENQYRPKKRRGRPPSKDKALHQTVVRRPSTRGHWHQYHTFLPSQVYRPPQVTQYGKLFPSPMTSSTSFPSENYSSPGFLPGDPHHLYMQNAQEINSIENGVDGTGGDRQGSGKRRRTLTSRYAEFIETSHPTNPFSSDDITHQLENSRIKDGFLNMHSFADGSSITSDGKIHPPFSQRSSTPPLKSQSGREKSNLDSQKGNPYSHPESRSFGQYDSQLHYSSKHSSSRSSSPYSSGYSDNSVLSSPKQAHHPPNFYSYETRPDPVKSLPNSRYPNVASGPSNPNFDRFSRSAQPQSVYPPHPNPVEYKMNYQKRGLNSYFLQTKTPADHSQLPTDPYFDSANQQDQIKVNNKHSVSQDLSSSTHFPIQQQYTSTSLLTHTSFNNNNNATHHPNFYNPLNSDHTSYNLSHPPKPPPRMKKHSNPQIDLQTTLLNPLNFSTNKPPPQALPTRPPLTHPPSHSNLNSNSQHQLQNLTISSHRPQQKQTSVPTRSTESTSQYFNRSTSTHLSSTVDFNQNIMEPHHQLNPSQHPSNEGSHKPTFYPPSYPPHNDANLISNTHNFTALRQHINTNEPPPSPESLNIPISYPNNAFVSYMNYHHHTPNPPPTNNPYPPLANQTNNITPNTNLQPSLAPQTHPQHYNSHNLHTNYISNHNITHHNAQTNNPSQVANPSSHLRNQYIPPNTHIPINSHQSPPNNQINLF